MKNFCYTIIIFCSGMLIGAFAFHSTRSDIRVEYVYPPQEEPVQTDNWNAFISAVSFVESGGDDTAVGTRNDVGRLQITPILLKDANRIVGFEKYSLGDRTDAAKSIEIWNVIQDHYNPDHDMQLALKIWNPRAPLSYHREIMAEYGRLLGIL